MCGEIFLKFIVHVAVKETNRNKTFSGLWNTAICSVQNMFGDTVARLSQNFNGMAECGGSFRSRDILHDKKTWSEMCNYSGIFFS